MDPKTVNLEGKIMGYEKKTLAIIVIVIIAALAAFYAGAKYEKHKLSALGLLVNKSATKKAAVGNSIKGTITAADDKSITIKMTNGSEKTIEFSSSMTFGTKGTGSASDLFIGELVVITGENNPDGSFAATNIRISKKSPKRSEVAPVEATPTPTSTTGTAPTAPTTAVPAPAMK